MSGQAIDTRRAFKRRCGWCGIRLRWWQLNLCRLCHHHVTDPWASMPCAQRARWDSPPDGLAALATDAEGETK